VPPRRGWAAFIRGRDSAKAAGLLGRLVEDYDDVMRQLGRDDSIDVGPGQYAEALYLLHIAYKDLGKIDGAQEVAARFVRLYPRDVRAASTRRWLETVGN
jgi:hypothetical protein